jgi:hypothetical protein
MTSLSRRNRRTTAWRITPPRTGISLAVLLVAAVGGLAADPPAAPDHWEKLPTIPPTVAPPAPVPPAPGPGAKAAADTPPIALPGIPGRTVSFQKPTGSNAPTPADPVPLAGPTTPVKANVPPTPRPFGGGTGLAPGQKPADQPTPAKPVPPGGDRKDPLTDPYRVFRFQPDAELRRRIINDLIAEERERIRKDKDPNRKPNAPEYYNVDPLPPIVPPGTPYQPKTIAQAYPPMRTLIEPDYVVHRRLYFEEKNSERYGWDLGIASPVISTLHFYGDTLLWPMRLASNPHERYATSAGKCYPGSPVPYYLYPPEIDLWGVAAGAVIYTGVPAIFP